MIVGNAAVMIQEVVAVDYGIQPIGNPKHFNFLRPRRGIIGKICIQRKIPNGVVKRARQFVNLVLNIEFGFSVSDAPGQNLFPAVFHRRQLSRVGRNPRTG